MSLFLLGFLIGIRHALDADHIAAVSALVTDSKSIRHAVQQGTVWGLGHTVTLLILGTIVVVLDSQLPESFANALELAVAAMLIILGVDVVRRVLRDRMHFHVHSHADGTTHFHAHAHRGESHHDPSRHDHSHPTGFPYRAMLVGTMHGMAGSAALILLTLNAVESIGLALIYMLLFGLGSLLGMAVFSLVIAVPLRLSARSLTWTHKGIQLSLGLISVIIGVMLAYEIGVDGGLLM